MLPVFIYLCCTNIWEELQKKEQKKEEKEKKRKKIMEMHAPLTVITETGALFIYFLLYF